MNTPSIDYQFILESDNSPLIVFDHGGRILSLNNAAEILLGYADAKELFDLALAYAPQDFGQRTTPMELHYRQLRFYAINVSYNSEEWVALRLYYRPRSAAASQLDKEHLIETDINTLLEAALTLFRMQYDRDLTLLTDQEIPPFKTDQNLFSKLLRKSLEGFRRSERIEITLKMSIGEFVLIENRRCPLSRLRIRANGRYNDEDAAVRELAQELQVTPIIEEKEIVLDIPMIR